MPRIGELKWTEADFEEAKHGRLPMGGPRMNGASAISMRASRMLLWSSMKFLATPDTSHETLEPRTTLAYWQNGKVFVHMGTQSTVQARKPTARESLNPPTGARSFSTKSVKPVLGMQVKLLRVLQERSVRPLGGAMDVSVDVRLIASTNRDLKKMVASGQFREDFYYRVSVIPIHVPPLRERPSDIEPLARHFLRKFALQMGKPLTDFDAEALAALRRWTWPGNVRELENAIEHAVAVSDGRDGVVKLANFPESVTGIAASGPQEIQVPPEGLDFEGQVSQVEKQYLQAALQAAGGVRSQAADLLKMSYRSFRHYAKKYGI